MCHGVDWDCRARREQLPSRILPSWLTFIRLICASQDSELLKQFNRYAKASQGHINPESLRDALHKSVFKWGVSRSELDEALDAAVHRLTDFHAQEELIDFAEFRQLTLQMSKQMFSQTLDGLSQRDKQLLVLIREHVSRLNDCSW